MDFTSLPALWFVVFVMFWSLPMAVLTLHIHVWNFWGPRNDIFNW
jgi:hypothetical protein